MSEHSSDDEAKVGDSAKENQNLGDEAAPDGDQRSAMPSDEMETVREISPEALAGLYLERGAEASPPRRIGPYEVLRKLGEGGMGVVYLGQQNHPIQRQVAIKLVRPVAESKAVLARFEAERQTLALMRHPGIAQVFDAGTTEEGQPYFAMEYVPGEPITDFCARKRLDLSSRLNLFIGVCEAIQHAHQKGIIHRDLKPDNILVEDRDGQPRPRIIDFGVAKALEASGEKALTRIGLAVGTPAYMSPEQANPAGLSAPEGKADHSPGSPVAHTDTRSDVYSLGVVLYEMLVGAVPFRSNSQYEILQRLMTETPQRPSLRRAELEASRDGVETGTTAETLTGDLDWILLKAMEKEPDRRYSSPAALAEDLVRFQEQRPVSAGPPSKAYRLKKFVRRHRVGVVAAGIVCLALLLAAGGIGFSYLRALEAEGRAARQAAVAQTVNRFLEDMLGAPDPIRDGRDVRVVDVLNRAAANVDRRFAREPEIAAALDGTLGRTYLALGDLQSSEVRLERALELFTKHLGPRAPETTLVRRDQALLWMEMGRLQEAETLAREIVEILAADLGPEHPDTLAAHLVVAQTLEGQGRFQDAEEVTRIIIEGRQRAHGPEHPDTLVARSMRANLHLRLGDFAAGEAESRQVLASQERLLGAEHPDTLSTRNTLAGALWFSQKLDDLEALTRGTLELQKRVLGPEHPDTLDSMNNLAVVLGDTDRAEEAEALTRETLAIRTRILGPDHPRTADSMNGLGTYLMSQEKWGEAEEVYRKCLALRERIQGPLHPTYSTTLVNLAYVAEGQGRLAEAEKLFRKTLALRNEVQGPDHPVTLDALDALRKLLESQNRWRDLASLHGAQVQALDEEEDGAWATTLESVSALRARLESGQDAGSDDLWPTLLDQATEFFEAESLHYYEAETLWRLVEVALLTDRWEEARNLALRLVQEMDAQPELDALILRPLRSFRERHESQGIKAGLRETLQTLTEDLTAARATLPKSEPAET